MVRGCSAKKYQSVIERLNRTTEYSAKEKTEQRIVVLKRD